MTRKFLSFSATMVLITMLHGCAAPYVPSGVAGGYLTPGYKERELTENEYVVSFFGNRNTPEQQVWNYWVYRCAELTLEKDFAYFKITPTDEHAKNRINSDEGLVEFSMLSQNESIDDSISGLRPVYYLITSATTYHSNGIVTMYKNPIPEDAGLILDAKIIIDELEPYVASGGDKDVPGKRDLLVRAAVEAAIRASQIEEEDADKFKALIELKV